MQQTLHANCSGSMQATLNSQHNAQNTCCLLCRCCPANRALSLGLLSLLEGYSELIRDTQSACS